MKQCDCFMSCEMIWVELIWGGHVVTIKWHGMTGCVRLNPINGVLLHVWCVTLNVRHWDTVLWTLEESVECGDEWNHISHSWGRCVVSVVFVCLVCLSSRITSVPDDVHNSGGRCCPSFIIEIWWNDEFEMKQQCCSIITTQVFNTQCSCEWDQYELYQHTHEREEYHWHGG